jgi:hypothetical protein
LSRQLTERWPVHRLVRVPALFPRFEDSRIAFDLLVGGGSIGTKRRRVQVRSRLERFLLPRYPSLRGLAGPDRDLARQLVSVIEEEYRLFWPKYHQARRAKWDEMRRRFRAAWHAEVAPAMAALNRGGQIKQIVIVLSPALKRHGKSYRVLGKIGRVATYLPREPAEMSHGLLYAFHEVCHGITDDLIFALGYRREDLSFKRGDKGARIHALIEVTANQAMFEALGKTNPKLQQRFITEFGDLKWLADPALLRERIALAGRELDERALAELQQGLLETSAETSRSIYEQGLLVPPKALEALRSILR